MNRDIARSDELAKILDRITRIAANTKEQAALIRLANAEIAFQEQQQKNIEASIRRRQAFLKEEAGRYEELSSSAADLVGSFVDIGDELSKIQAQRAAQQMAMQYADITDKIM